MSKGVRHPSDHLLPLAKRLMDDLRPHGKVELAGSLQRGEDEAGDIDLVFEPRTRGMNLRPIARQWGTLLKAGDRQIIIEDPNGVQIDLSIVRPPAQWGVILAARTGPAERWMGARDGLKKNGMFSKDGCLYRKRGLYHGAEVVPCPDTETFYRLAGEPS